VSILYKAGLWNIPVGLMLLNNVARK